MPKRLAGLALSLALVASGCSVGASNSSKRQITGHFSRAIQVFPGNSVRVLGVTVGRVTEVRNVEGAAEVVMRIDDPDIKLPADVQATLVPVSLLGERYVQLFPAYNGGAEFTGDHIALDRTSVPAEQDELLRGLQDYFGALDPDKVTEFVTNAATILEGNGESINRLIDRGSDVFVNLANKRDSLAGLIQELDTLVSTLSTRQEGIARLIHSYNDVGRAISDNRVALEGTITGLSQASAELASLLIENRDPLGEDIRVLTRTFRTMSRNADRFARTGKWAVRLFKAADKAVDYDRDWLRLGNQGAPLFELLMYRLEDRFVGVCMRLGLEDCSNHRYWQDEFPDLFCAVEGQCDRKNRKTPGEALDEALDSLPNEFREEVAKQVDIKKKNCKEAKNPKRCRKKKRQATEGTALDDVLKNILDGAGSLAPDLGGRR
jgi:phospholipid/cholesterol/gamma-HCH transport system substrate-binding protein